ncbi:MAG: hypothetical protein IJQ48_06000 [Prevotella sp.]|nr:hypothetical protein [Prevotella sp.]
MNAIHDFITNYYIVQWATILSPIIAVALAWWTSRSGARDTKKLNKVQLELMRLKIAKEIEDAKTRFHQLSKRESDDLRFPKFMGTPVDGKFEKSRDLSDEKEFMSNRLQTLNNILQQLDGLNKTI